MMTADPKTSTASHREQPLVLVVDDAADIRTVFKFVIQDIGCEAIEAENGLEALSLIRSDIKPSLILLDLMMPVMDGWQLDNELAADPEFAKIPTVVITAFSERVHELKRNLEVLQKPVPFEKLRNVIKRYCFDSANLLEAPV